MNPQTILDLARRFTPDPRPAADPTQPPATVEPDPPPKPYTGTGITWTPQPAYQFTHRDEEREAAVLHTLARYTDRCRDPWHAAMILFGDDA